MTLLDQILISIITASITAGLAYFGFWRQAKAELYKEYETKFNSKKWEVYLKFIELLPLERNIAALNSRNPKYRTDDDNKEIRELENQYHETIANIENEILLIGSRDVINAFITLQRIKLELASPNEKIVVEHLFNVINAMRIDLGKDKSNINYTDFGNYFVYIKNAGSFIDEIEGKATKSKNKNTPKKLI